MTLDKSKKYVIMVRNNGELLDKVKEELRNQGYFPPTCSGNDCLYVRTGGRGSRSMSYGVLKGTLNNVLVRQRIKKENIIEGTDFVNVNVVPEELFAM